MKRFRFSWLFFVLLLYGFLFSQEEARLLRFPATDGKQIVFTYAGDLYSVPKEGGVARRLTGHEGYEMFPRFSSDGKWLAFTAQYDGNTEVYVMPSEGGVPRRLTYTATLGRDDVADRMGPNNIVMTWKNTSDEIVFRSRMRSFNSFIGQLYTVSLKGDLPEQVPVPRGGFCSFSPDDRKMAYNRIFREFRTWKRYRGGMADDVWIFDFNTRKVENITDNPAQDIIPMWAGDKIYFLSDRDEHQRMNLFVYDLTSKETTQLTHFTDYDIKFPSLGKDAIVFEYAGYIYRFDLETQQYENVTIRILEDFRTGRGGLVNVSKKVSNYEISPDGKRALFGARGEVFTVPAKEGPTRNLTRTSGVHERNSKWSPDGKWVAFISDQTGINEIYIIRQDGSGKPIQITDGADTYYYQMYWSPDSRKLLWADKKQRLRYVDINTKKITEVDQATAWEIRQYTWSPDNKWIAYMKPEPRSMDKIYLYSLDQQKSYPVTEGWYNSNSPAFSADGKYLLFASSRDFNPIYSWTEWNHAYRDMERVYLVPLSKETPSPFEPRSDEVTIKKTAKKKNGKGDDQKKEEKEGNGTVTVKVDIDGIADRVIGLPISPGSYGNISAINDAVYYIRRSSTDKKPLLMMYDLKKKKETELGQVNGYEISTDGKKMLVSQNNSYYIIDLPKSKLQLKEKLNLSGMEMRLDRHAEWQQIFHECWVQMRDFFYAPNMHGVNWEEIRKRYEPLLKYVNHRNDLTYIIGEMIGELNAGHAYVGGGERPDVKRIRMGLLGAELERDAQSGYYRIRKILKGENWNKRTRSPLTEVGVNVKEGDYIIAVNGHPTHDVVNIYELLINTVDKQVVLRVNSKPSSEGSREVTVIPIGNEGPLYYYNWVQNNIEKVNKATNGKVGYIHIPDMGVNGLNEFVKHFYPQLKKKALIIDVRGNGGGNVSPMIIERLRREIAMITIARNTEPDVNPHAMVWGPKVLLVDEFSASDGDIFTFRFKKHKLGKVIGKRSWGGVVGIRGSLPLLDGGYLYRPEFSRYDVEGKKWIIEGYGVAPDIFVDNDPGKEFAGEDQQLNKAIEVILEELKTQEKTIPPPPPYPER